MKRDFTPDMYRSLLCALQQAGYVFLSFEQYCLADKTELPERFVILRHDVDKRPKQSLCIARLEHELDARATYYFRVGKESNDPDIIHKIAAMGHEIGYHYEDMSLCRGDAAKAEQHFAEWLQYFRQFYPVRTTCMHGAPQSRWDSKLLWQHCDYHDYGIIGEPYYDTDFSDVFYLTDTGRRWDGYKVSMRDKIPQYQDLWNAAGLTYHSTTDILAAIEQNTLPRHIMITTHPQRWLEKPADWLYEAVRQSGVNIIKRIMIKVRHDSNC